MIFETGSIYIILRQTKLIVCRYFKYNFFSDKISLFQPHEYAKQNKYKCRTAKDQPTVSDAFNESQMIPLLSSFVIGGF